MKSLKARITISLIFIFSLILLFGISSMILVYRLGVNSQTVSTSDTLSPTSPFSFLDSLDVGFPPEASFTSKRNDTLNTASFLNRLEEAAEAIEAKIQEFDRLSTEPKRQEKIDSLKKGQMQIQNRILELKEQSPEKIELSREGLLKQYQALSDDMQSFYTENWVPFLNGLYWRTEATNSVLMVFALTFISFMLMLGAGIYSARTVGRSEKKLNDTLHARNEEKRKFISYVSHELKTSVSGINLNIKILKNKRTGALNDDQREIIKSIQEQSDRLIRMVNETKEFSRKKR